MTLCNLYSGGRAALYDLRYLKAFSIRTTPCRLPDAANEPVCRDVVVAQLRPVEPTRESPQ